MRSYSLVLSIIHIFLMKELFTIALNNKSNVKSRRRPLTGEILSGLTILHRHLEQSNSSDLHSTRLRVRKHITQQLKPQPKEVYGFRLTPSKNTSQIFRHTPVASSLQSKNKQDHAYPVYRFYSSMSAAYMNDGSTEQLLSAKVKDPRRIDIEWEWITLSAYSAAYLRSRTTKRYICFNSNGRPTMQKTAQFSRCLLRINAVVRPIKHLSRSVARQPETFESGHYRKGNMDKQQGTSLVVINLNKSENTRHTVLLNLLEPAHEKNMNSSERSRNPYNPSAISPPQLVWISTAAHLPVWRVRFCSNGMPFAYHRPLQTGCKLTELGRLSEVLILCPRVPENCRKSCGYSQTTRSSSHIRDYVKVPRCNDQCRRILSCARN